MNSAKILLVDDCTNLLDLTSLQLEKLQPGFEFYKASSGEEALDYINSVDMDVIISDYNMPGINGIELLEKVEEEYGEQNFVLYTANSDVESELRERDAVYVEKGDLDSLNRSIASLLE